MDDALLKPSKVPVSVAAESTLSFQRADCLSFAVVVEVRCSVKVGSPWVWDEEWQDK